MLGAGCDKIGQTPAGGSDAQVKAFYDSQPLETRVKELMASPAPWDEKVKRIKDMYAKEGKPVPDNLLQGGLVVPVLAGVPGSNNDEPRRRENKPTQLFGGATMLNVIMYPLPPD